jgi:hypothetical protein
MRLPAVDATLTVLVFLEWPTICPDDTFDVSRVCFTTPSAIRFLDAAWAMSASSGILAWAAAIWESWCNWDSWLEPWALPLPGLTRPPLAGGVNTGSAPFVEPVVPWELLRERASGCRLGNWGG